MRVSISVDIAITKNRSQDCTEGPIELASTSQNTVYSTLIDKKSNNNTCQQQERLAHQAASYTHIRLLVGIL